LNDETVRMAATAAASEVLGDGGRRAASGGQLWDLRAMRRGGTSGRGHVLARAVAALMLDDGWWATGRGVLGGLQLPARGRSRLRLVRAGCSPCE